MRIKTARLHMTSLLPEHWRSMKEIFKDFSRSEYAVYDRPMPLRDDEIQALVEGFAKSGNFLAVFDEQDRSKMLGYVCFRKEGDSFDIGYCFHSKYHGSGYGKESVSALMDFLSDTHGAKRFTAGTALDNLPSVRLLEKLGFTLEGTEQLSFCKDEGGNDITFTGGNYVYDTEKTDAGKDTSGTAPSRRLIIIDGNSFSDLEGFYDEAERKLTKDLAWTFGRSLSAFADLVRGGFGVHGYGEPVCIKWLNSEKSRRDLGYSAAVKYYESLLEKCHPANLERVTQHIKDAKASRGDTLFDLIISAVEFEIKENGFDCIIELI